ncbi:MAG: hypothetical protein AAB394_02535 [Patescibacteria group bacterium]
MRISELGRFYPEGRKTQEEQVEKESFEKEKDEVLVTPEQVEKKITTAEVLVGAIALGIRAKLFMDDKGTEVRGVFEKAKEDILTEPTEVKPVLGRSIMDIGSLIVDHIAEKEKRKLEIRQSFADSVSGLAGKINELKMLRDFEEIQQEGIVKTLRTPLRPVGLSEDEKIKLREKIKTAEDTKEKKRKEGFYKFINGLLNS